MATMKKFLGDAFSKIAAFHVKAATEHSKIEKSHQAMAECMGKADADGVVKKHHTDLANHHRALAAHHNAQAEACSQMADDCEKAAEADLAKIRPDRISSVITQDAPESAFGIRAVPRRGSPAEIGPLSKREFESVDPTFRHLISNMEEME